MVGLAKQKKDYGISSTPIAIAPRNSLHKPLLGASFCIQGLLCVTVTPAIVPITHYKYWPQPRDAAVWDNRSSGIILGPLMLLFQHCSNACGAIIQSRRAWMFIPEVMDITYHLPVTTFFKYRTVGLNTQKFEPSRKCSKTGLGCGIALHCEAPSKFYIDIPLLRTGIRGAVTFVCETAKTWPLKKNLPSHLQKEPD